MLPASATRHLSAHHVFQVSANVPFAEVECSLESPSEISMRLLAATTEDATGLPFTVVDPLSWIESQGEAHEGRVLVVDQPHQAGNIQGTSLRHPVILRDGAQRQAGVVVEFTFNEHFIAVHGHKLAWTQDFSRRPLILELPTELVELAEPTYRFTFDLDGRDHQVILRCGAHREITDTSFLSRVGERTDAGPGAGRLQFFEGGPALQPLCEWEHLRVWQRDAQGDNRIVALGTPGESVVWTEGLYDR